jgi:hypothetical protein
LSGRLQFPGGLEEILHPSMEDFEGEEPFSRDDDVEYQQSIEV